MEQTETLTNQQNNTNTLVENTTIDDELIDDLQELGLQEQGKTVFATITRMKKECDDTITVTFQPPIGEVFTKKYDLPKTPDKTHPFSRLLELCGQNYATLEEGFVGEQHQVPVKKNYDGEWEIQYESLSRKTRVKNIIQDGELEDLIFGGLLASGVVGAMITWPIGGIFVSLLLAVDEGTDEDDEDKDEDNNELDFTWGQTIVFYIGFLFCWLILYGALSSLGLTISVGV